MKFFKRMFHDAVVRFQGLLGPVFDSWDERLGSKLDHELICELIVRFVLSEHLIGEESERRAMPRRITRLVETLRRGGGGWPDADRAGQAGRTGYFGTAICIKLNTFAKYG
ncbi:hypothetical protein LP415_14480 [Polaromonas sp. P1(28)-8]|nr:hypothetical protein LP415_14480 [Polaromonas sp. P1(28)-8]